MLPSIKNQVVIALRQQEDLHINHEKLGFLSEKLWSLEQKLPECKYRLFTSELCSEKGH